MSRDVMTAKELARYLSVSETTIYRRVENGEIPFTKIGERLLRFPKLSIDRWLAEHTQHPERTLLDEFEILYEKFHLKKFLRAKGIAYSELNDQQLLEQLMVAIDELRAVERAEAERRRIVREGEV
jgi:excisionase family DNA binding protein